MYQQFHKEEKEIYFNFKGTLTLFLCQFYTNTREENIKGFTIIINMSYIRLVTLNLKSMN